MSVDSMRKGMTAERDRNKEDNIQGFNSNASTSIVLLM